MSLQKLKLFTAEVEYLEMLITKKQFDDYLANGIPEAVSESLDDHLVYCRPTFDERVVLLIGDEEIPGSHDLLATLYQEALAKAGLEPATRKKTKKYALVSERYIKRSWYELDINNDLDISQFTLEIETLPGKEPNEDFFSFKVFYQGKPLEFSENYGADSSDTCLRDDNGFLYDIPNPSEEEDDEDGEWVGDEDAARAELIATWRDDWNPQELVESYGKQAAIIKILSDPDSHSGLMRSWRFTKKKHAFFYDACRKWPVKTVVIDDPENLAQLESYDQNQGLQIYSHGVVADTLIRLKDLDEELLDKYRENTDPKFKDCISSVLTQDELNQIEAAYPEIKTACKNLDWLEISEDTPTKELATLKKFEQQHPNDTYGRMANTTWEWGFAISKIMGPIEYGLKNAQVIELRTCQPEFVPVSITQAEYAEFKDSGLPEDVVRSLDWAPGFPISVESLNPATYNEHITLLVNGEEVEGFADFCKATIEPLLKSYQQTASEFAHALYVQSPNHKRDAWFSLVTYEAFDIAKLSAKIDSVMPAPNGEPPVVSITLSYDSVPFQLAVWHSSPERKGAFITGNTGRDIEALGD